MLQQVLLFGGSFDPPHVGHRQVVEYLAGLPGYEEVWVIPVFDHPFSKDLAPFADRVKMLELTLDGLPGRVQICRIEEELGQKPSYTIDVVRALRRQYPQTAFTLAVGSDCREELKNWKESGALQQEAAFHFFPRPGFEKSVFMDISSSRLREMIRKKEDVSASLHPQVLTFIRQKKLYVPI